MARRADGSSLPRQPSSTTAVNKFGPLPTIGPFFGAGRRRSAERSAAAQRRREGAATIAEMLVDGGLAPEDVYLTPAEVADTMLAFDGTGLRDELGRPRRTWAGYPDHAHTRKVRAGREYALFAEEHDVEQVIQVVIRPPESNFALGNLAAWHARHSDKLGEMLRYARKSRVPDFAWDLVSAEIENAGNGGWLSAGHFHLTTRGADDDAHGRIQTYFAARGWGYWFTPEDDEDAGRHPSALVQYQAKGLADAVDGGEGWRPDALAELRRQTRDLSLVRATGEFRRWKAKIAQSGMVAAEDENGRPILIPRRITGERPRRKLLQSASAIILRWCIHDFGDGLLRRALHVRGDARVTLPDLSVAFDLAHPTISQGSTATPESEPCGTAPPCPPPPSDPPRSGRSPPGDRGIPW